METFRFKRDYRCPTKIDSTLDYVTTAVNAVAICSGRKWEDIVKSLMEQAHLRAYMPSYVTCVTDMLRVNGFVTMPHVLRIRDLPISREREGPPGDTFIVRIFNHGYFAVVPDPDGTEYTVRGIRELGRDVSDLFVDVVWKYVPGTDNRTGIKRDGFAMPGVTAPHKRLAVKNMNPKDHNIGDCAVRALCAALECSWDEAIDLLIKASGYTDPIINSHSNISNALIGLGFERHKAIRRGGRLLTGKQFCEQMTYTFHNEERIFALVGKTHCAAVLPFAESDGSVLYKAQDTWDSTDRRIEDYWVIPPRKQRERKQPKEPAAPVSASDLRGGNVITHPVFGEGVITAENGDMLTVTFASVGEKRLSRKWLLSLGHRKI